MNDMSSVIVPKSDQVNAEDYISGPRTYVIEGVSISPGSEQPVSIRLAGEKRVWRPCKSMSRCMVAAWGPDANKYAGKSVTLYCDPKVKWGGMEVGGIRISHMSHIERDMSMALTATRGKRAMHIIKVLQAVEQQQEDRAAAWVANTLRHLPKIDSLDAITAFQDERQTRIDELAEKRPELHSELMEAISRRGEELARDAAQEDQA